MHRDPVVARAEGREQSHNFVLLALAQEVERPRAVLAAAPRDEDLLPPHAPAPAAPPSGGHPRLRRPHHERGFVAIAEDREAQLGADRRRVEAMVKVGDRPNRGIAEPNDHVAAAQPRVGGRATGVDGADEGAARLGQAMLVRHARREHHLLETNPKKSAAHAPVGEDLRDHEPRRIAGNREAEPLAAEDRGVDPNDMPLGVEERAAGVARVERRVGLDHPFDRPPRRAAQRAAKRAHDPGGDRAHEPKGRADRDRVVPNFEGVRIAQLGVRERRGGGDLEHREIGRGVGADHVGHDGAAILQRDLDRGGPLDHVMVGEGVAVGCHERPRAR